MIPVEPTYLDVTRGENWKTFPDNHFGQCFILNIPRNILQRGIRSIELIKDTKSSLIIYLHQEGSLFQDLPRSYRYIKWDEGKTMSKDVYIEMLKMLDYGKEACDATIGYYMTDCVFDELMYVSID